MEKGCGLMHGKGRRGCRRRQARKKHTTREFEVKEGEAIFFVAKNFTSSCSQKRHAALAPFILPTRRISVCPSLLSTRPDER